MTEDEIEKCTIKFSVCKALPSSECNGISNSSTCEVVTLKNNTQFFYSIGDFRGSDEFAPLGKYIMVYTCMCVLLQPFLVPLRYTYVLYSLSLSLSLNWYTTLYHAYTQMHYSRSGNLHVGKLSYDKFS